MRPNSTQSSRWRSSAVPTLSEAVGVLVVGLTTFAVGFVPLFGGPGYEYALACGLILPGCVAVSAALTAVGSRRHQGYVSAIGRGVLLGIAASAVAALTATMHGLRVGFCSPLQGFALFLLGPGAGAVLAGVWGGLLGSLLKPLTGNKRIVLAVVLALAAPTSSILISLLRFYGSPMIFAFDPFVGFFAGALYDTVISGLDRLLTYRVGSLATVLAVWALFRQLRPPREGRRWPRWRARHWSNGVLLVLGALTSSSITLSGPRLGHYQTANSIATALGGRHQGERCEVLHSREMLARDVALLARECDAHVQAIESFLGSQGPSSIRVYLFNGPDQKGWLMGAANTYIAKPWRNEVYLQAAGFPHPVLAHELAHVIAGGFGRGPFKIAGDWGGWLPDPGRIEGIAVAAAPSDEADLTASEWAKAMLDLQLLPSFDAVFGLGFLAQHSTTAYTVAGAFLQYLRDQQGPEALRGWYSGQSLEQASGATLAVWEQRFREHLATIRLSEAALNNARRRFDQPGVFARRCPHDVDQFAVQGRAALARWDIVGAQEAYREVLALDPHHLGARLDMGACLLRSDGPERSGEYYQQLALDPELHGRERSAVLSRWADLELQRGNVERAGHLFEEVARDTVDEDELRQLDVKQFAARALSAGDKLAYQAIVALLLGDVQLGQDWAVASALLAQWSERAPEQGFADYLLGKNLFGTGRWDEASQRLDQALQRKLQLPRVQTEAVRTRLTLACAQQDAARLRQLFIQLRDLPGIPTPRREGIARFVARCGVDPSTIAATPLVDESLPPGPQKDAEPSTACPDTMLRIRGGEFWMGTTGKEGTEDDRPRYKTRVRDFCLNETEITMADYQACVEAGQCTVPHGRQVTCNYHHPERGNHPINCVDHAQATAYCAAREQRLPTEVEWEYAAKGGREERKFSWGNEVPEGRTCWNRGGSCAVKSYPAGAFGLFDMTGNVWEWTADYFGPYPWPTKDQTWKIYRGGSWSRRFEKWMVNTLRNRFTPKEWGSHLGFRCAKSLSAEPCPFGTAANGSCLHGVLDIQCAAGTTFNGLRCAAPGEPECLPPSSPEAGYGCVDTTPKVIVRHDEQALRASVTRSRSSEFDADCRQYQAKRPHAYRFEGATSPIRNEVVASQGCKNRDVSASWNSACCP